VSHPSVASHDSLVPVLTEIVDEATASQPPAVSAAGLEALARELERALLSRLAPEIDRVMGQALEDARAELAVSVSQIVREAVAASVAPAAAPSPKRD
jgi:hypothetical protein